MITELKTYIVRSPHIPLEKAEKVQATSARRAAEIYVREIDTFDDAYLARNNDSVVLFVNDGLVDSRIVVNCWVSPIYLAKEEP